MTDILNVKAEIGLEIKADFKLNDVDLESDDIELFEVMVMRDSRLVGQTLRTLNFRQIYDLTVLGNQSARRNISGKNERRDVKIRRRFARAGKSPPDRTVCCPTRNDAFRRRFGKRGANGKTQMGDCRFRTFSRAFAFKTRSAGFEVPLAIAVLVGRFASFGNKNRPLCRTLYADRFSSVGFDRLYDEFRRGDGKIGRRRLFAV